MKLSRRKFAAGIACQVALGATFQPTHRAWASQQLTLEGLSPEAGAYGVLRARRADGTAQDILPAGGQIPEVWARGASVQQMPWRGQALRALEQKTRNLICYLADEAWDTAEVNRFGVPKLRLQTAHGDLTQELLRAGILLASPEAEATVLQVRQDLHSEAQARKVRLGIWGAGYQVWTAADTPDFTRSRRGFAVVVGQVASYQGLINKEGKPRSGFLNFGTRPKRDFSVRLSRKIMTRLMQEGIHPDDWLTQTLEVRGWLEWRGGPYMALANAWRLQLQEPPSQF